MRELVPGTVFAGHRVEDIAGRGGMGIVYRATELASGRCVALKLIADHVAREPEYLERFERESQVTSALAHPNVIPVYRAGEEDGVPYITMRFVEGRDLGEVIAEEGRLGPRATARMVTAVASALDAAHARGLVHRDVKPGNVLMASDGVYLTDFGLSKDGNAADALTGTNQFIGTLDYAAPEAIDARAADGRADIYSLGCVLFQALTGHLPYERDSDVAKLYAHLKEPPPKLAEVLPGAPAAMDEVIGTALAKDPDERQPSAGELARAASAVLEADDLVWPDEGPPPPADAGDDADTLIRRAG